MARNDLTNLILGHGELHILMAQLGTLGSFIENSGVDLCFLGSDLYGPTTVKQILEGKHVKRGETAHMLTLLLKSSLCYTGNLFCFGKIRCW